MYISYSREAKWRMTYNKLFPDEAMTVDSEAFQVAIRPVQAIHSPCCAMKTIKTRQYK